jgi:hypothetical protein
LVQVGFGSLFSKTADNGNLLAPATDPEKKEASPLIHAEFADTDAGIDGGQAVNVFQ